LTEGTGKFGSFPSGQQAHCGKSKWVRPANGRNLSGFWI
jgi:hypothetical protein